MASLSSLQAFFFLLLVVSLSHAQTSQNEVIISKLESRSSLDSHVITLQCSVDSSVPGNRSFFHEIDNMPAQRLVVGGVENSIRVTFNLTPELEGYYFCQVGNITSNRLLVVAYPVLNLTISTTRLPPVSIGSSITVPCAYSRGRLADRYNVTWYKGLVRVDTTLQQFDRYQIQQDFSLEISSVVPDDASDAYHCKIRVRLADDSIVEKTAPNINVNVQDPLMVRQNLTEKIIMPNNVATFTCEIGGAPEAQVKWTFNGQPLNIVSSPSRQSLRNVLAVSHTITLNSSLGSGQVTCVAYHMVGEQLEVVSSEAHLIVLSDRLKPSLSLATEGPRLAVQFPSTIPGQFELVAYYQNMDSSRTATRVISHPSFRNTAQVDIAIPFDKLPGFSTFTARVALSVANMTGGASVTSNQITIDIGQYPNVTDCLCQDPVPSQSNSAVTAGLAAFVVILLIVIAVLLVVFIVILYLNYKNKRTGKPSVTKGFSNEGGHFSEEEHEMTKSPLSSSPSPQPRYSTRKGYASSHGSEAGDVSSDEDATGGVGHKKLRQWDEKRKVPDDDDDAEIIDRETGMRMQSRELNPPPAPPPAQVEYKPPMGRGCVTNIPKPRPTRKPAEPAPKMKPSDSTSSFEDLEEESREFKEDIPRTM